MKELFVLAKGCSLDNALSTNFNVNSILMGRPQENKYKASHIDHNIKLGAQDAKKLQAGTKSLSISKIHMDMTSQLHRNQLQIYVVAIITIKLNWVE